MTENNETNAHVAGTNGLPRGRRFNWRIFGLLTAGIIVGLVGLAVLRIFTDTPPKPPERDGTKDSSGTKDRGEPTGEESGEPIDIEAVRREAWQRIEPRLQTADKKTRELTNQLIGSIESFFDERREGTKAFAEAALGWSSKWELIKSREGHRRFIAERFAEHIFTQDELAKLLKGAADEYAQGLKAVENELLVQVRADLESLPSIALPAFSNEQMLRSRFDEVVHDTAKRVADDLKLDVGRQLVIDGVVAVVITKTLTTIATRMGISGAVLGTGAASSWATLGAGIAIAIAVDALLDWVIGWFYDPVENLSQKVAASLDAVKQTIMTGDQEAWEVYSRIVQMAQSDLVPELRAEAATTLVKIEQGGALGLKHALGRVADFHDRTRQSTLKQLMFGGEP